ncbi:MAG: adenylyl-sulfate kinase, partial [Opitutales bacterium]
SSFEAPEAGDPDWAISTDNQTEEESLDQLLEKVLPLIKQPNS